MRLFWKARYEIFKGDNTVMTIQEENSWVKVMEGIFGAIPVVGIFSGYVFHPAYLVSHLDGGVALRMEKQPAFFEGVFKIEKNLSMSADNEKRALLSLMMILLERRRG